MKIGTKQIALLAVAVALLVVGYKHEELANLWKGNAVVETTPSPGIGVNPGEDAQDAFVNTGLPFDSNRLERDSARAKTKEIFQAIVTDANATESTKTDAYESIVTLTLQAEQESKVEGLIREKGFTDAYACFSDLGEIDVLVKAESLNETQVTQIADIIVRHTGLDYWAIHIRKVA